MKSSKLPKNWIVLPSKTYPDRLYYFNVKNGERSWDLPQSKDYTLTQKTTNNKITNNNNLKNAAIIKSQTSISTVEEKTKISKVIDAQTDYNDNNPSRTIPSKIRISSYSVASQQQRKDHHNLLQKLRNTTNKVIKKNTAKERMETLRKKLATDIHADESLFLPNVYTNMDQRKKDLLHRAKDRKTGLKSFKSSIDEDKKDQQFTFEKHKQINITEECYNDIFHEEMEWEPIQDEKIMSEIYAVRTQISTPKEHMTDNLPQNKLELTAANKNDTKKDNLYIVIDTNVFLSDLQKIKNLKDAIFKKYGRPYIVVPWTVIQELDIIKDNKYKTKSETLRLKARKAINFLYQNFSQSHPRVLGQSADDAMKNKIKFNKECPDDMIYQTCLQIKMSGYKVVLLTFDKNLSNKAIIHGVTVLGRHDSFDKIDTLNCNNKSNTIKDHFIFNSNNDEDSSIVNKELLIADDILTTACSVLKTLLTAIVSHELYYLYGKGWKKYSSIKPPWTLKNVLKCALNHWIAIVHKSFDKKSKHILSKLADLCSNQPDAPNGYRLKHVEEFLENMNDLVQLVSAKKHVKLVQETSTKVDELRKECSKKIDEINATKFKEEIGSVRCSDDEENRANYAFVCFEKVYTFVRDLCGAASEAARIPFSFVYQKDNEDITRVLGKSMQFEVIDNLARLLNILKISLDEVSNNVVNYQHIKTLYDVLISLLFIKDTVTNNKVDKLEPLDLYCCLKKKQDILKRGVYQLQEVHTQFCKLADVHCQS